MTHFDDHPIAGIFPLLPEAELKDLAADIKANGLHEPIMLHEGKVLDGRNRYRACEVAGVEPRFETYQGDSPVAYVISLNLKRRHLTVSQGAACATEAEPMLAEEIEKERRKNISAARSREISQKIDSSEQNERKAASRAAEIFNTNRTYVADAKRIKEESPEDFEAIKCGEKTITEVKREMKRAEVSLKVKALPTDKYRVIYADPPWQYNDKRALEGWEGTAAEQHYPSMSIAELCALPVKEMAADNAVLFMWTTSPLLYECAPVIRAWGFEYKANFVWDKVRHNVGHYNSVRHEFLLVCTRGSCTPDNPQAIDSVQTIERTGKHSEKPEEFRKIIDSLYMDGRRIELFARKAAEGWERWGNEA